MLWILFSLLCVKYIFVWFSRSVGFEGNITFAKKRVLRQPWNDVAAFTQINKIVFPSPEATVINLVSEVFAGKK